MELKEATVFYEVPIGGGGGSGDDVPWSHERFAIGDRVKWTPKAIRCNIPTKSRRELRGTVTAVEVGTSGATFTVAVLWDTYKRPHRYAASFITKVK
jgi:hypothetical protein